MDIKLRELYRLRNGKNAYDNQKSRIFALTLLMVKNSKLIEAEIKDFEDARDLFIKSDEYRKYQEDRNDIINEHKQKDEKGNFVMTKNQQGNPAHQLKDIELLNGKLATLDDDNKGLLKKMEKHSETVAKKMEDIINLPLSKITVKDQVKILDKQALVDLAPLIGIKLTKELLGDKADDLKSSELDRLLEFCEFK